jgi:hypothetical protein
MQTANNNYLNNARKVFQYYKSVGDKAMAPIAEEGMHWQFNAETNSIAIIVRHMAGNSLSRWTDFLNSDGEKDWRDRDGEFEDTTQTKAELLAYWEKGWTCLFDTINPLSDEDLFKIVYIRGEAHTVTEAINRQLAHLAYHTGQIVFVAKMIIGTDWKSLTIPKGQSKQFSNIQFLSDKK